MYELFGCKHWPHLNGPIHIVDSQLVRNSIVSFGLHLLTAGQIDTSITDMICQDLNTNQECELKGTVWHCTVRLFLSYRIALMEGGDDMRIQEETLSRLMLGDVLFENLSCALNGTVDNTR